MKKKILLVSSLLTAATPTFAVLASCVDTQKAAQEQEKSEFEKNAKLVETALEIINNSKVSSNFYRKQKQNFLQLKEDFANAKTTIAKARVNESLGQFYKDLLKDWSSQLFEVVENTKTAHVLNENLVAEANSKLENMVADRELEKTVNNDEIEKLKAELKKANEDLALATVHNGNELSEELAELKANFLPRQRSGKFALMEAQRYLIDWYTEFLKFLNTLAPKDPESQRILANYITNAEGIRQSTELSLESTRNTPETYENRNQFRVDLAITMERIKKIGDAYKRLFNYDLPYPKSEAIDDLYDWRIENFKRIKTAIEANDASVYDRPEIKTTLISFLEQIISQYAKVKLQNANYAEQVFSYVFLEENYALKYVFPSNSVGLDVVNPSFRLNLSKNYLLEYPLYNRIYDSETTAKIDVFYLQTRRNMVNFWNSEGSKHYITSLGYRRTWNQFWKYLENTSNYKYNAKANTYYEILGTFNEANLSITNLAVPIAEIEAKRVEIVAKIDELKDKVWQLYLQASRKISENEEYDFEPEDFRPYTDLKNSIRDKRSKAMLMSDGTFVEAFDKYIAFLLLEKYAEKMLEIYDYWKLLGDNPKSDELEAVLRYKTKSDKLLKKMNNAKNDYDESVAEKTWFEAKIFPLFSNFEWPNFDDSSLSDEQKVTLYKEKLAKIKEIYDNIKTICENIEPEYANTIFREWVFDDYYKNDFNEIQQAFENMETVQSIGYSQKELFASLKEKYKGRKETVIENEVVAKERYESAKATYEAGDLNYQNYIVPNQELYALIRQWNIKNRAELSSLQLSNEAGKEPDTGALQLFNSYSTEWSFGHEDTQNKPYIHITNLDIDDIENNTEDDQYSSDKVKAKLLEIEKRYFEANEAYLEAKKANADNLEALKNKLVEVRKEYYDFLNNPNFTFLKSSYAKYNVSHYGSGQQVILSPFKLANIYASEVASYEVLKQINEEYIKDSEN
ncbi:hypothetical protein [Mycoplasmopsis glycophila]|uniref:Lipoprotein n=1 Tax=Mycoplasmopsis glycophila TaxID=171285 RepID=A0A449AWF4_9BACT|nr:hypothetical protein [Mycoplasmopsis glycophila]VEU71111.1 Uncharacterised protein [Mycoplasmopsis glycophila]